MTNSSLRPKNGFTLIELLISVAVIGVLAALLMPSFGKSIERSRSVQCASNLRQLYSAMLLYAQDNDGLIVQNQTEPTPGNTLNWGQVLGPYLEKNTAYQGRISGVFSCPKSRKTTNGEGNTDYGKNVFTGHKNALQWGSGWPHPVSIRMINVTEPSKIYAFADSYRLDLDTTGPEKIDAFGNSSPSGVYSVQDGIAFRHKGGGKDKGNVIFFDGHVEVIGVADMITTGPRRDNPPWCPIPRP
jgi:prepilin-type N-terminal cleavage/methylation domain-containing protein/prepilin-type processing-associated H-X9-DG protein